jgi:hypothetical protein
MRRSDAPFGWVAVVDTSEQGRLLYQREVPLHECQGGKPGVSVANGAQGVHLMMLLRKRARDPSARLEGDRDGGAPCG